jgi:hypothetical protein
VTTKLIGTKYVIRSHHDPVVMRKELPGISYLNYFILFPYDSIFITPQIKDNPNCIKKITITILFNSPSNRDVLGLNFTEFSISFVYFPVYTAIPDISSTFFKNEPFSTRFSCDKGKISP